MKYAPVATPIKHPAIVKVVPEYFNIFAVLDGHGEFGHKVSRFARDFIKEEIQKIRDNSDEILKFQKKIYQNNKK